MKRETRLPEQAVDLIYNYDPTFHREHFQKILEEIRWVVSIWKMIASQKRFVQTTPPEQIEFKEEG